MGMTTHRCWTRRAAGSLAGLLLLLLALVPAAAREPSGRTLRVAFPQLSGVSETDQYGQHSGLMVDYLNEIAKYTNWTYEYIDVDANDLLPNFLAGEYDLMGGTFYSPDFESLFAYPDYSTGRSNAVLLCRRDDASLLWYDLTSLNGKTIGVYENATEKIRHLGEYLACNDLDCTLRYYAYEELSPEGDLYDKLRSGEVDMLMGNELEIGKDFRMVASFQAQPYYIVARAGDTETLAELNTALAYIQESTPTFAEEVFNANFPDIQMTDIQLNGRELAYVAEKQSVTVAVPRSWHPLYCKSNPLNHHDGMIPEMLAEVAAFTGLEFNYIFADTYDECLRMVREGEAELLGAYFGSDEEGFAQGLSLTRSYAILSGTVFKHKSVSYPDSDLVCGILKGRTLPAAFTAAEIREYDTATEMVAAVNRREVDYIYGASAMLEQEMQVERYMNVVPVSQAGDLVNVSFGLTQPVTPELMTVLNKAICSIPSEEKTAILNHNLVSVGYSTLSIRDLLYDDPTTFALLLFCFLASIVAGVALWIHSRMSNALMRSKLEAAEAKSLAKSEFLSRMSHEIRTPMNAIVGLADLTCMEQDVPPGVEEKLQKIRGSSQYLLSLINDILDMSRIENGKMELEKVNFSLDEVLSGLEEMMGSQAEQKGLQFQALRQLDHRWVVGDPVRLRQILTNLLGNAVKFTAAGAVSLRVEELSSTEETATYRFSVTDTGSGIAPEDLDRIFAAFEQVSPSVSHSVGTGLGLPISRSMARLMGGDLDVESAPGKGSDFFMTLTLPLGAPKAAVQQDGGQRDTSLVGIRTLLVEDHDLNAEIARALLAAQGMEVRRAINGQQAVDLFFQSPPGTYQVILMDIRMPVKDGYQATREIRASGRSDADVPIVAMTANSFKEDEAAAQASGMDGFVAKPVDVGHLLRVLRDLLGPKQ